MPPVGAHILHVFPGFDPGGTQMRTVQLLGMLPRGTRHSIVAMDGRFGCMANVPAGVEVRPMPRPPRLSFWSMGRFMAALLHEVAPDLVLTYNWGAIETVLGARRARVAPLVHHEDGFGPEEASRPFFRRSFVRSLLLPTAAAVVVPSRRLLAVATTAWHLPAGKVHYLPNGVDLARFVPAPQPREGPTVFGHVGHLRPEKNQRLLLEAFAASRARGHATLRIFGDGAERPALLARAAELGLGAAVEFRGAVADTAPCYREMDVFVLSSDTEQMPLTVLEAMASGLPVVSTDVGDVRAMVATDNRELFCQRRDVPGLAALLDHLALDAPRRRRLGAANRARCETEFDRESCYGAWVALYARCLARP